MGDREKQIQELLDSLHIIRRVVLARLDTYSERADISVAQFLVLRVVGRHEGVKLKEIAGQLGLTSSAVTQMVDILARKGYLTRQENALDRRALEIRLTDEGEEKLDVVQRRTLESLFDVFDDEELQRYCELYKEISARFSGLVDRRAGGSRRSI